MDTNNMNDSSSLPEWEKHLSTKPRMNIGIAVLLTFITCGVYGIYNEYKMARSIAEIQVQNDLMVNNVATICLILTLIGLSIVSMTIQQAEINKFYVKTDT